MFKIVVMETTAKYTVVTNESWNMENRKLQQYQTLSFHLFLRRQLL